MMKGAKGSMQNSDVVLYNLSKHATKKEYRYDRLYRNLYNKDFYACAYKNINQQKRNLQSNGLVGQKIEVVIASLRDETYQPHPIEKINHEKGNSKARFVSIPTLTDHLVQEICSLMLEAIYEPTFLNVSFGLKNNQNRKRALIQVQRSFSQVHWWIKGTIKDFYQSIDFQVLIQILRKRIKDERLIRLIWKFLRAGYVDHWPHIKTSLGLTLATIYYNEFDQFIMKQMKEEFWQRMSTQTMNQDARLIQFHRGKERMKNFQYVRCGNEFLIGMNGRKEEVLHIQNAISQFLNDALKVSLSEEMKRVHRFKSIQFLDYDIRIRKKERMNGVKKRGSENVVSFKIPKGTIEKFIISRKMVKDIQAKKWHILHRPQLLKLADVTIIETYNNELKRLYEYYSFAENVSQKMGQLKYVMEYSCLKTLANKYRSTVSKMKAKYRKGKHWGATEQTDEGEKIVYFYKDGFKMRR